MTDRAAELCPAVPAPAMERTSAASFRQIAPVPRVGARSPRRGSSSRRWRTALLGRTALLVALAVGFDAQAQSEQEREVARQSMQEAFTRFQAADYAEALRLYRAADDIMHVPTTGLGVATAQAKLGLLLEARATAQQVAQLPVLEGESSAFAEARERAQALVAELTPRIPTLVITVQSVTGEPVPGMEVAVDEQPLAPATLAQPHDVNPGRHVVVASAPGYQAASVEREVPEAQRVQVVIALQPVAPVAYPSAPADAQRSAPSFAWREVPPLAFAGWGVGALGFAVGGVTGVASWVETAAIRRDECDGTRHCDPESDPDRSTAHTLANVSNVALGVGVVGAAVGTYAWFTRDRQRAPIPSEGKAGPAHRQRATVELIPIATPSGVLVTGRF